MVMQGRTGGQLLEQVHREPVHALEERRALRAAGARDILAVREEFVGKVAVEDDGAAGERAEERDAGGELVDDVHVRRGRRRGEEEARGEVQLARVREEDVQPAGERAGERRAEGAHGQRAVARLVEAVGRVVVRGVDRDGVAAALEAERGVDDEALGAAWGSVSGTGSAGSGRG
jgi:hypothetical protein